VTFETNLRRYDTPYVVQLAINKDDGHDIPRASIDSNCNTRHPFVGRKLSGPFGMRVRVPLSSGPRCGSSGNGSRAAIRPVPIGTNFIVMVLFEIERVDILFDPSLPVTDLQAKINTYSLGLSHSFGVLGHVASIAIAVPYANANLTGNVEGAPGHAYRVGIGGHCASDSLSISWGGPALTRKSSLGAAPSTILRCQREWSLRRQASTFLRLINVGSNRLVVQARGRASQPIGNGLVEGRGRRLAIH